jgi:hypothetical protein
VEDYLEILSLAPNTILPTNANGEANPADAITKGKPQDCHATGFSAMQLGLEVELLRIMDKKSLAIAYTLRIAYSM